MAVDSPPAVCERLRGTFINQVLPVRRGGLGPAGFVLVHSTSSGALQ